MLPIKGQGRNTSQIPDDDDIKSATGTPSSRLVSLRITKHVSQYQSPAGTSYRRGVRQNIWYLKSKTARLTAVDVRSFPEIATRVDARLAALGLSDTDSSEDDDALRSSRRKQGRLIPAQPDSPAFVVPSPSGTLRPVTKNEFVRTFRQRLSSAGVSAADTYRGHSFRRGGANWAFSSGLPGELIQIFGDWSSDAYKCYLEYSLHAKLRVSQTMTQSLDVV
ncbi:hypothetical protein AC249_AIPGENE11288 [Exaiptasia diaphana]|nr:hypothetical protein AC249_AIPGENE11288 [Exaiptasia diaphana]